MKNEFGATLDKNGYAESIIPHHGPEQCWHCDRNGSSDPLNRHEIFFGPYREKSKRLGLWVYLCHDSCHQGADGVHNNKTLDNLLKYEGQRCAMKQYGWSVEEFIQQFGKNYM